MLVTSSYSSVGIVPRLRAEGLKNWGRIPVKGKRLSSPNRPDRSGVGPAFSAMNAGLKWPGCEVGQSPESNTEDKIAWSYTSTNHIRLRGMEFNYAGEFYLLP
jgi:hypothetical protein